VDEPSKLFSDEKFLKENNLELPLTAKIDRDLKLIGVDVKTDYKIDNLIEKIVKKYNI
jgi:hypothetical protein